MQMQCLTHTEVHVTEGQSGTIVMTLRDEAGALVEKAALTSITLDLYYWTNNAGVTINDREHQDVLDNNGGLYYDDIQTIQDENGDDVTFNYRWDYTPDDTPFLRSDTSGHQTEEHTAHFHFTWAGDDGGLGHEVKMTVTNFRRFPVTSP